jgi:hypothetical protein
MRDEITAPRLFQARPPAMATSPSCGRAHVLLDRGA